MCLQVVRHDFHSVTQVVRLDFHSVTSVVTQVVRLDFHSVTSVVTEVVRLVTHGNATLSFAEFLYGQQLKNMDFLFCYFLCFLEESRNCFAVFWWHYKLAIKVFLVYRY